MIASTPTFTLSATIHGISPLTAVTAALANLGVGYTIEPLSVPVQSTFRISPAAIQSAARSLLDRDSEYCTRSIGALTKDIATTYGAPVTPELTASVQHAVEQDDILTIVRRQRDGAAMYRRADTFEGY